MPLIVRRDPIHVLLHGKGYQCLMHQVCSNIFFAQESWFFVQDTICGLSCAVCLSKTKLASSLDQLVLARHNIREVTDSSSRHMKQTQVSYECLHCRFVSTSAKIEELENKETAETQRCQPRSGLLLVSGNGNQLGSPCRMGSRDESCLGIVS